MLLTATGQMSATACVQKVSTLFLIQNGRKTGPIVSWKEAGIGKEILNQTLKIVVIV